MTITSNNSKVILKTSTGLTNYPFNFKIFEAKHIVALIVDKTGQEILLTLNSDYTIEATSLNNDNGGEILLSPQGAIKAGNDNDLIIRRNVPLTQQTDLVPYDKLPAETLEKQLDLTVMMIQGVDNKLERAVLAPENDEKPLTTPELTALIDKAKENANTALNEANKAKEEADRAKREADNASSSVGLGSQEVIKAKAEVANAKVQADRAKREADRAEEIVIGDIPIATNTNKGLVQIGNNIIVNNSIIEVANASPETKGVLKVSDKHFIFNENNQLEISTDYVGNGGNSYLHWHEKWAFVPPNICFLEFDNNYYQAIKANGKDTIAGVQPPVYNAIAGEFPIESYVLNSNNAIPVGYGAGNGIFLLIMRISSTGQFFPITIDVNGVQTIGAVFYTLATSSRVMDGFAIVHDEEKFILVHKGSGVIYHTTNGLVMTAKGSVTLNGAGNHIWGETYIGDFKYKDGIYIISLSFRNNSATPSLSYAPSHAYVSKSNNGASFSSVNLAGSPKGSWGKLFRIKDRFYIYGDYMVVSGTSYIYTPMIFYYNEASNTFIRTVDVEEMRIAGFILEEADAYIFGARTVSILGEAIISYDNGFTFGDMEEEPPVNINMYNMKYSPAGMGVAVNKEEIFRILDEQFNWRAVELPKPIYNHYLLYTGNAYLVFVENYLNFVIIKMPEFGYFLNDKYWVFYDNKKVGDLINIITYRNVPVNFIATNGSLVDRELYAELLSYAEENNLIVSEEQWEHDKSKFGAGTGENNFRLPLIYADEDIEHNKYIKYQKGDL